MRPEAEKSLEEFLFELQQLEKEGKNTRDLQKKTWEEIKREIEEKVSREQDHERNPNRR